MRKEIIKTILDEKKRKKKKKKPIGRLYSISPVFSDSTIGTPEGMEEGLNLAKKKIPEYIYFDIHVCYGQIDEDPDYCANGSYSKFVKIPRNEIQWNTYEFEGEMFNREDAKEIIIWAIKNANFSSGDWNDIDYVQELDEGEYNEYTGHHINEGLNLVKKKPNIMYDWAVKKLEKLDLEFSPVVGDFVWEDQSPTNIECEIHYNQYAISIKWYPITHGASYESVFNLMLSEYDDDGTQMVLERDAFEITEDEIDINSDFSETYNQISATINVWMIEHSGREEEEELAEEGGLSDTLGQNDLPQVPKWESGITRGHANPIDPEGKWESGITRGHANSLFEGLNLQKKAKAPVFDYLDQAFTKIEKLHEPGMGKNLFRLYAANDPISMMKVLIYPSGSVSILQHRTSFVNHILETFKLTKAMFSMVFEIWFTEKYGNQIIKEGLNLKKKEKYILAVKGNFEIIWDMSDENTPQSSFMYTCDEDFWRFAEKELNKIVEDLHKNQNIYLLFTKIDEKTLCDVDNAFVRGKYIIHIPVYYNSNNTIMMEDFDEVLNNINSKYGLELKYGHWSDIKPITKLTTNEGLNLAKKQRGMIQLPDEWKNESVSRATLRSDDLADAAFEVLRDFHWDYTIQERIDKAWEEFVNLERDEHNEPINDEDMDYIWEDVWQILVDVSPEGTTFGTHEGDGSDFGFWEYEDEDYDDDDFEEDNNEDNDDEFYTPLEVDEGLNLVKKDSAGLTKFPDNLRGEGVSDGNYNTRHHIDRFLAFLQNFKWRYEIQRRIDALAEEWETFGEKHAGNQLSPEDRETREFIFNDALELMEELAPAGTTFDSNEGDYWGFWKSHNEECSECGSEDVDVLDYNTGEAVCNNCGIHFEMNPNE